MSFGQREPGEGGDGGGRGAGGGGGGGGGRAGDVGGGDRGYRHDEDGAAPSGETGDAGPAASELAQYTQPEHAALWQQIGEGKAPQCPRCLVAMHPRAIGGGSFGLGYARQRVWLLCPRCHRSAIFDTARGTRN